MYNKNMYKNSFFEASNVHLFAKFFLNVLWSTLITMYVIQNTKYICVGYRVNINGSPHYI